MVDARELELAATLSAPVPTNGAQAELAGIVRDLYRRMTINRRALKVVDRCAVDLRELAAVWFDQGRWTHVELLASYLERRIADGHLRPVPISLCSASWSRP